MEPSEIRLRLIEAAAKNPIPHRDGFAAGVLEQAKTWEAWVNFSNAGSAKSGTLTVPKK